MNPGNTFFFQKPLNAQSCFFQLRLGISLLDLFYDHYAVFIHRSDKIPAARGKEAAHKLQHIAFLAAGGFHDHDRPLCLRRNMQLFGAAVDIHKKQIIQQKVFDKIILIKPLFISDHQALKLKSRHLAHHIGIFPRTDHHQYIFGNLFVVYLKKLISGKLLAVRRRFDKISGGRLIIVFLRRGSRHFISVCIHHYEIHTGYCLKSLNRILQNLV